jgi:hypothetical protein
MPRHQNSTKHIYHLHHESQKAISALFHCEQHRLDVVFEEYSWDLSLAYDVRLFGYGVLVGEERTSAVWGRGVDCVDGGNYGEKVLEFVEVVGC